MKVNSIDCNDIMTIEEFMERYSIEINNMELSNECINNMYSVILDQYNGNIKFYKNKIKSILLDIIYIFYNDNDEYIDSWRVKDLFNNIIYLNNDYRFDRDIYNIDKLFNDVLNDISYYNIFNTNYIKDDFILENCTNIEYIINRLKEIFNKIKPEKELYDFINQDMWRFL